MKALVLSSDDIQNFSKLIYDPKAAAQLASSAVAAAAAGGVAVSGGGVASHNVVARSLATDSSNLMALQYYLKHPANNYAVATSNAPVVAAHTQHQQLLAQSQTQLKQLQLKQPTIHQQQHGSYHHHPYYQQNSASSSIVLATPTHTLTTSGHHSHNHHQQQQQQHHHHQQQQQQQQQQQHHHHHSQSHAAQQQQQQQSHGGSVAATAILPVHALNQNSNFSAASSSTGGGTTTTSSHAPTQQSNSSSISPTAQRNTPANNNSSNSKQQQQQQQHHQHNQSTSASTVAAANALLRANGGSSSTTSSANCAKKIKTEPLLSAFNQSERLNFANTHIGWSEEHWKRVIFQDERKFNLDGPDGFSYYFHDLRNYERMLSQRPRGNSVYIYLLITVGGPIHLEVTTAKLKPETCIETILRERPSIVTKLGGNTDFILQDHNWMSNALPTAQDWLNAEGLKTQKWPTIAHDLNIMENIWGWLIREVFDGGRKFSRKDDLIFRIREAWARLPIDLITNLYTTLPERVTELYYTRGVYTNC